MNYYKDGDETLTVRYGQSSNHHQYPFLFTCNKSSPAFVTQAQFTHPVGKTALCKRVAKLKGQTIERKPRPELILYIGKQLQHLRVDCAFYPSHQVACRWSTFFQIFSSTLITSTTPRNQLNTPVWCQDYPFEVHREIELQSRNSNDWAGSSIVWRFCSCKSDFEFTPVEI